MKRVLCATDLSERSDEALRQADAMTPAGGVLAVSHVVPELARIYPLFPQRHAAELCDVVELTRRAEIAVRRQVAAVTRRPPDEVPIYIDVGSGYPEVLARADAWGAELLVVGARAGASPLGTTAVHVVRHARIPVLAARPGPADGPVVAATDLSDGAMPAVEMAAVVAEMRRAPLVVLHAFDLGGTSAVSMLGQPYGVSTSALSLESTRELRAATTARIEAALRRFGASGEVVILEGPPAATILLEAGARGAELLVVGAHGRTGFARIALGSVAESVVRGATCPVLAVRLQPDRRP